MTAMGENQDVQLFFSLEEVEEIGEQGALLSCDGFLLAASIRYSNSIRFNPVLTSPWVFDFLQKAIDALLYDDSASKYTNNYAVFQVTNLRGPSIARCHPIQLLLLLI